MCIRDSFKNRPSIENEKEGHHTRSSSIGEGQDLGESCELPAVGQDEDETAEPAPQDAAAGAKAETFRRRRLSTMGDANTQRDARAATLAAEAKTVPASIPSQPKHRGRRPSISLDMDPSGKKIEPS
eukprot:TRINITY_DN13171_c0_g1_i1.p1 TRINITY_DN13171_c0_g1~~TRINITY_DN13171_c0_g1_i1.p1  ORF type:complete len:127 (-),score=17.99 TRINITY_DN13171_c0_g1_i1:3-383(-)